MSFWNLSDNTTATTTGGSIEVSTGDMTPIPADTAVLSAIEEAKWDDYEGDHYISLKWRVLQGDYIKRVIFQKLYVSGDSKAKDSNSKADKAKRMLAAIATNCGGDLLKLSTMPSDMDLMRCLVGRPMWLKLQVWEMTGADGKARSGNWVCAVAPKNGAAPAAAPAPVVAPSTPTAPGIDFSDDIPF